MDLSDAMRTTGAVRRFVDEPVPDEVLFQIFDTARFAPSGGNRQGWRVILVRDPSVRERLQSLTREGYAEYAAYVAAGRVPFSPSEDGRWHGTPTGVDLADPPAPSEFIDTLASAPVLAVLAVDLRALAVTDVDLDRQSIVGGASIYPFAQNVLLAARNEGLGGVLTTFLCRREAPVASLLSIPAPPFAVAALIALGRPGHMPRKLTRRPVDAFVTIDRFDGEPFAQPDSA
jgi:nitroreductase